MKTKVVNSVINYLQKTNKYSKSNLARYRYSAEALYSLLTKMGTVMIIAIIFKLVKPTLWLLLFYTIIRMSGFGIHASKNIYCWIITLSVYIITPILIINSRFDNIFYYLLIPMIISIIVFCPADTPKRPLIHKSKRTLNKILIIITCLSYLFLTYKINSKIIKYSIFYAITIQFIVSNPLVYKLFGIPFNNYKKYKSPNNLIDSKEV